MCLVVKPAALIAIAAPSSSGSNRNTASGVEQLSMNDPQTGYVQSAEPHESGRHIENIDTFMEVKKMAIKCSECGFSKAMNMPRSGTAGSWRSGRFGQQAYSCKHPDCGNMKLTLFYGATAPRDCPRRKTSKRTVVEHGTYKFSPWGIFDTAAFCSLNKDFVEYCKKTFPRGTFTTYENGEPVFLIDGMEFSKSDYSAMLRGKTDDSSE